MAIEMNIDIHRIPEAEFQLVDIHRRIIVDDLANHFGLFRFSSANLEFAIAWRSSDVAPVLQINLDRNEIWIGIDQRIVCVKSCHPLIALALGLPGSFIEFKLFPDCTLVVSDTQILAINRDFSVRSLTILSDVPDRVDRDCESLSITFLDGSVTSVSF
jgi:hypothetical protein